MMWNFERFSGGTAALDENGRALTYAQLAAECGALMDAAGGRCLAFCLCRNALGGLLGYAGLLSGGIVPAMLSADMDAELLARLYSSYRPKLVWLPSERAGGAPFEGCEAIYERFEYTLLKTPFGDEAKLHPALALLLTTSGSTGSPKFVRLSYDNLRANTDSIVEYLSLSDTERAITALPMYYTYGLSVINTHLDVGAALLMTDKGVAQRGFWQFVRSEGATSFSGVPYTYEMLDRMRFTRMELPSLRTLTQAGGKLLPELHAKFAAWCLETGRRFIVMYGACEATARMAYLPWEGSMNRIGSMGVAIPGGRFELIGDGGEIITRPFVTGELVYYGRNVTLGYAEGMEDLAKGDERHGRLETGDMAQMDADGYYTIVGRRKRFLKLFGNRVNLDETERLLKARFPGTDCACGGTDDKLMLFATDESSLNDMRRYLAEKTGLNISAFHVRALPQIPKNEAGKTLYRELERYYD